MKISMARVVLVAAAGLFLLAGSLSQSADAHSGATGIVKQRMDLMDKIAESMKALAAMFRGKAAYDAKAVERAARIIEDHAGEAMTKMFPEGTNKKPSEALPVIWQDWDEFKAIADELKLYAGGLRTAASNPRGRGDKTAIGSVSEGADLTADALKTIPPDAVFALTGRTCSACHKKFRLKTN